MEFKSAYQKMITSVSGGWGAMAGALGMTITALENKVYEKKGETVSVHLARQIEDISGTTLFAEAAAKAAGGTFIKLPSPDQIDGDLLMTKGAELSAEVGELFREFAEFTRDGEIDAKERARMELTGQAIHRKAEEFLAVMFSVYCPHTGAIKLPTRGE